MSLLAVRETCAGQTKPGSIKGNLLYCLVRLNARSAVLSKIFSAYLCVLCGSAVKMWSNSVNRRVAEDAEIRRVQTDALPNPGQARHQGIRVLHRIALKYAAYVWTLHSKDT